MRNRSRQILRPLGVLLAAGLALGAWSGLAREAVALPALAPETREEPNWYQRQRLKYFNYPLVKEAERLLAQGRYAEAEKRFEHALANDPSNLGLKLNLIECTRAQSKLEKSVDLIGQILRDQPDRYDLRLERAFAAFDARAYAGALSDFEAVKQRHLPDPSRLTEMYRCMALAAEQVGDFEKAGAYATAWTRVNPTSAGYSLLASAAIDAEDWEGAAAALARAAELDSGSEQSGRLQLRQGYVLLKHGDLQGARDAFLAAGELLPGRTHWLEIQRSLGQIAYLSGEYKEAMKHFKSILLEQYDEDVALAYLSSLAKASAWTWVELEAEDLLQRPERSAGFTQAVQRQLLAACKNLGQHQRAYELALELHRQTGDREFLLDASLSAKRVGLADEAVQRYQEYLGKRAVSKTPAGSGGMAGGTP